MQIALDCEAQWQAHRGDFRQACAAQFREPETKIAQAEQSIAVAAEFAEQPGRRAHRIEEFDEGHMVGLANAIGQQALAQGLGKKVHRSVSGQNISSWLRAFMSNSP